MYFRMQLLRVLAFRVLSKSSLSCLRTALFVLGFGWVLGLLGIVKLLLRKLEGHCCGFENVHCSYTCNKPSDGLIGAWVQPWVEMDVGCTWLLCLVDWSCELSTVIVVTRGALGAKQAQFWDLANARVAQWSCRYEAIALWDYVKGGVRIRHNAS